MTAVRLTHRLLLAALAGALVAALLPGVVAADGHAKTDEVVEGAEGTDIAISIYRPAGADADNPAPVILHSHGWGGSRTSSDGAFSRELDRGFGVVSIDQRGFGESGGQAHVQNPDLEGRDVVAVIDHVASLDWVAKDTADDDPVLFAMGGSYGGGFQFAGAFTDLRDSGRQRFNALAPDMTWFNLARSLAPEGVVRSAWATLLYAVGIPALADHIHPAFVYGATTGQWPDGTAPVIANLEEEFFRNGPSGFVADGLQLDVPVLLTQGASDNLFNLNEGWHNFERSFTDEARTQSLFVGYNGGHALPNVMPLGFASGSDACTEGFADLRLDFFEAVMADENPRDLLGAAYSLTTADGSRCVQVEALDDYTTFDTGFDVEVASGTISPTGAGAPQHLAIAEGPLTVAGVPQVHADVYTAGVDQRVFFALSVGTNPADAQVVQNNMMPLRELTPVIDEARTIELPGVAVDVAEGETLYLTVSPVSDMSFAHGSARTPGLVALSDITVDLPLVGEVAEEQLAPGRSGDAPGRGGDGPPGRPAPRLTPAR